MPHEVVIVGGGFGGLQAAQSLRRANVNVTLVDRENYHLFQPLLYQVATGGLSPANIATPLRSILRRQRNVRVLMAEATGIDARQRQLFLAQGQLTYDTLILATGARHHYFGKEKFERLAPGLKTITDATTIRRKILVSFEQAEQESDPAVITKLLTFIVVGAGPPGSSWRALSPSWQDRLCGPSFAKSTLRRAQVVLIEGQSRVLPGYPPSLSQRAIVQLQRMGVAVRVNTLLDEVSDDGVLLVCGEQREWVPTKNVFWAAGVQASPLGRVLAEGAGAELDRAGRVKVQADCTIPTYANLFVIGDLAHCRNSNGDPLPGTAAVAQQQGKYVARVIKRRLAGKPVPPFAYRNLGQMATIGRAAAVCDFGWLRFGGFAAWLTWLFLHLMLLVGFQNRVLVLFQWCWNYITRNRSARLITNHDTSKQPPATTERY